MSRSVNEVLDRLYLEWSQRTMAKTAQEMALESENEKLHAVALQAQKVVDWIYGGGDRSVLSAGDMQDLIKALKTAGYPSVDPI